jgi:hypothetical protein
VLVVQIADIAQELAGLEPQTGRQVAGRKPGLFDLDLAARFERQIDGGIEIRINGCREGDLRFTQIEPIGNIGSMRMIMLGLTVSAERGLGGFVDQDVAVSAAVVVVIASVEND